MVLSHPHLVKVQELMNLDMPHLQLVNFFGYDDYSLLKESTEDLWAFKNKLKIGMKQVQT